MGRKYNFNLPIVIGSFKASFVPGILKDDGIWDHVPKHIQDKFSAGGWSDVTITQEDLDELDNATWNKLKKKFAEMG
jgi:hypothetical protein